MEYENLFFTNEQTQSQIEYLVYNIEILDEELFSSFNINPLRKKGLDISSMFYASLCLKLYPLLTIAFQVHTFHNNYKDKFERYYSAKKRGEFWLDVDLDEIIKQLHKLREKNRKNEDRIRDYYKLYTNIDREIWYNFDLGSKVQPINHIGLIEYDKEIQPFEHKSWNKFLDVRNSIEHRGVIETKLSTVIIGFASLYLLIKGSCYASYGLIREFNSQIFGNVYTQLPPR
jgi:hypothetical protein